MTTLLQIVKRLQELAPREMTVQGLESRVEIGPQTETDQTNTTVNRLLIATYPSARVVTKASQDKSNLLVTYRPLFPFAVDRLSGLDLVRIRLLTKNYISTYVIGSGWLCARDGLNDALLDVLGLQKIGDFSTESDFGQLASIGRICKPPGVKNHSGFANYIASKLNLNTLESAIANPANSGLNTSPNEGYRIPAAIGSSMMLYIKAQKKPCLIFAIVLLPN